MSLPRMRRLIVKLPVPHIRNYAVNILWHLLDVTRPASSPPHYLRMVSESIAVNLAHTAGMRIFAGIAVIIYMSTRVFFRDCSRLWPKHPRRQELVGLEDCRTAMGQFPRSPSHPVRRPRRQRLGGRNVPPFHARKAPIVPPLATLLTMMPVAGRERWNGRLSHRSRLV